MKMGSKTFRKVLLFLLIILIVIQFIRPDKNVGIAETPTDIIHYTFVPDTIMTMLKISCYDCHSNNTNYPWYAEISPVGLLLAWHIREGKKDLNFSDFSQYTQRRLKNKLTSIADQLENGEMPITSYLLLHPEAKLNEDQIKLVKGWTDNAKAQLDEKK
jgi:hypothetical protein